MKNYTIPFVQLDPLKTILVFSHIHNSYDKKLLLSDQNLLEKKLVSLEQTVDVTTYIDDADIYRFFMIEIDDILTNYKAWDPSNKPDVNAQIEEIHTKRKEAALQHQQYLDVLKKLNLDPNAAIVQKDNQILIHAEIKLQEMSLVINDLLTENKQLKEEKANLTQTVAKLEVERLLAEDKIMYYDKKIRELIDRQINMKKKIT